MKNKADQHDTLYQHPGAIGVRPSAESPFVTATASGISTTLVLLDSGISAVAALPRVKTEDRPKVYCPFCGRRGKYNKNRDPKFTRLEFFSHLSGDEDVSTQILLISSTSVPLPGLLINWRYIVLLIGKSKAIFHADGAILLFYTLCLVMALTRLVSRSHSAMTKLIGGQTLWSSRKISPYLPLR